MAKRSYLRGGLLAAAAAWLVGAAVAVAQSDTARMQLETAIQHAGFAATAPNLVGAKLHTQHVINCLVRPDGSAFNERVGNPCADQGQGVIADLGAEHGQYREGLRRAVQAAQEALASDNPGRVRAVAQDLHEGLRTLHQRLGAD